MSAPANCCTAQQSQCIYRFKGRLPVNPHMPTDSPADLHALMVGDAAYAARRCLDAAMQNPEENSAVIVLAQQHVKQAQAIADAAEAAQALRHAETSEAHIRWLIEHPGLHPRSAKRLARVQEASLVYKRLYAANRAADGCVVTFTTWCQCGVAARSAW